MTAAARPEWAYSLPRQLCLSPNHSQRCDLFSIALYADSSHSWKLSYIVISLDPLQRCRLFYIVSLDLLQRCKLSYIQGVPKDTFALLITFEEAVLE